MGKSSILQFINILKGFKTMAKSSVLQIKLVSTAGTGHFM